MTEQHIEIIEQNGKSCDFARYQAVHQGEPIATLSKKDMDRYSTFIGMAVPPVDAKRVSKEARERSQQADPVEQKRLAEVMRAAAEGLRSVRSVLINSEPLTPVMQEVTVFEA